VRLQEFHMRRLTAGTRLVVASHNKGKLVEIDDLVRPYGLDTVSAAALGVDEPEETEATFVGNARLKALHSARATGLAALADDSGLEVHDLGGAPGVYSARWAGPLKDFQHAMRKVADELTARHAWRAPGPRANFVSVLALAWPDGHCETFEGKVFGTLVWPPRGTRGFGYDPMFLPDGETETYGEMDPARKHATSHRARAFAQFVEACLG
jgi:XTP/dITP diphosphohydrolase